MPDKKKVFLGYPFGLQQIRHTVQEACEGLASLVCADSELTDLHLLDKIQGMMTDADLCLFDVTQHNVNVAVEYGMARILRFKPKILYNESPEFSVKEGDRDVFTDLRGMDSLRYKAMSELKEKLRAQLPSLLAADRRRIMEGRQPRLQMRLESIRVPGQPAFLTGSIVNAGDASANGITYDVAGNMPGPGSSRWAQIGTLVPGESKNVSIRYDNLSIAKQITGMEGILVEYISDSDQRYEQRGDLLASKGSEGYSFVFNGLGPPKKIDNFGLPRFGLEAP